MAGAESDISSGRLIANAYRVDALLGQGGMGEVWSASHVATGKRVALKFLKAAVATPYSRRRFLREARAASAVKHPNVVAVHDVIGLEDDVPVLVMDLLVGESLAKKLERERQLSVAETATLLAQVVSAVGTAHELGIVHRDLKPDNVFLCKHETEPPTVKVLDFGIAKLIAVQGDAASTGVLTATGSMLGTPFYMSPEQTFGERDIDHRTDIWSLGVILYECLSGGRPIRGENFGQIFKVITTGSFPAIERARPGLPEPVARLVGCMLSLQREDRPTDLRDVLLVLSQYSTMGVQQFGAPRFNTDPPQSETQSERVVVDGTLPARPVNGDPSTGQATTAPLPLGTSDPHTVSANAPESRLRWRPRLLLPAIAVGACVLAVGLRLLPTSSTLHPRLRSSEERLVSPYPHCRDLLANCGRISNENCCASSIVSGGTYYRSYDGVTFGNQSYPATTIEFRLDRFEVSVGRFRQFLAAYDGWRAGGHPTRGEGSHPGIDATGWEPSWEGNLAATAVTFASAVKCDATFQTWTDKQAANETRPINCLNWYDAFAFCAWDGGRLPTEAEWNHAAAGGNEQRAYPWGATPPEADARLAVYGCHLRGLDTCSGIDDVAPVGHVPAGDGKYGQADLAGNVWEWVFDAYLASYQVPCDDCAALTPGVLRVFRGGDFDGIAANLLSSNRGGSSAANRTFRVGVRCARAP